MRFYKHSSPKASEDNIWDDDLLDRKAIATYLSRILRSSSNSMVINLDAPYGSGKSWFLDRLRLSLKSDGFPTLLFNAWETDHAGDPCIAFVATIAGQLKEESSPKSFSERSGELIQKGGKLALRYLAPAIIKAVTAGVLDVTKFADDHEIESRIYKAIGDAAESIAPALITNFSALKIVLWNLNPLYHMHM